MVGVIAAALLLISFIFSIVTGKSDGLNDALFSGTADAISFCLKTGGLICFFCGIMNIAKKAGIVSTVSKLLRPVMRRLIPDSEQNAQTAEAVSMNISSNILGLGNAATPFGIKATDLLLSGRDRLTRSAAAFLLLNTACIQLIPTTIAAIRQTNGAAAAFDILPATLCTQLVSCAVGLIFVFVLFKKERRNV